MDIGLFWSCHLGLPIFLIDGWNFKSQVECSKQDTIIIIVGEERVWGRDGVGNKSNGEREQ